MKQIYRLYGIPNRILCIPFLIALSLSLVLLIPVTAHAQVNSYARVTAINGTKTQLTISNRNETYHTFTVGEEVIVMQMQDTVIGTNTANNANFGNLSAIANAGFYEIAVISAINGGRTTITLSAPLSKTFSIGNNSRVQVVSFTQLSTGGTSNFITTAAIPAVAFNGNVGGVVAIQVPGTLTLRHNITADGQGFTGGAISDNYENECEPGVYRTNSANYAAKGQGIYLSTNTNYARGRARCVNGGGGGSDDNAGGAGGGNYSAGGDGGAGWTCNLTPSGGLGGIALNTYLIAGTRLFMGGGGGGGQGNNSNQTAGGAGGGIIIIKAGAITTNCTSTTLSISANGSASPGTSGTGNDGAGGGGAGGTILLQVGSWSVSETCRLNIQANGGNGGDVNNAGAHGGGGGGGQGAILFTGARPTTNVTTGTTPGTGGLNSNGPGGTRASNGSGNNNAGIVEGIGTVLPIRLLHFSAENSNKKVLLSWSASGEANALFTVQRAADGINFTTIGTVKGASNSTVNQYTFTDPNPVPGKNFYQLQMRDEITSQITYSTIVSVNITEAQSIVAAWPNPAHDHFSVRVSNEYRDKNHVVTITDLTGKVMYTNTYKPANGIITVTPGSDLKPGFYLFKLTSEGYEQSGKVIIR
ncbi:T9SS type A sorting domain-containing protein [Niastella caeni]|uniref:T9SS type A sorting domain-containing protein n=1 Tax=Niastella caeni TaxID=2569763 RepID=A0A4S8HG92_9BACT|nr:T9SS type A sorting domain-containing protein [Niastella caeni]THU34170.1 T9SS type A sorting domain-containing protein [Niastella caeni]